VKFLYVYDGHWPHNATRVSKQVNVLLGAGHEVTILSRGRQGQPREESQGGLSVYRLPTLTWKPLDRLATYPVFLNPVWLAAIRQRAAAIGAAGIIVRDLPLAPAAIMAGRLLGIPVHYDMAEVYPAALWSILPHESGPAIRIVRALRLAEAVERWVVRRVATTFVVSEDSRERCIGLGVPAACVVLVGNTPEHPEDLLADWPVPAELSGDADRLKLIFVGNVFADRGLRFVLDALPAILDAVPSALLVVVGDGRELPKLEAQAQQAGLGHAVRFLGWRHHDTHAAYLRHAHIGLLPFLDTEHIRITLANKLFDYMGAGLPVIATDVPSMRRIIDASQCGMLVPPSDAESLAREVIHLLQDSARRAQFGAAGRAAVARDYAWKDDARRFLDAVGGQTALDRPS
jgi:glycosyltransferase involved in cell wall biosynthesis